MILVASEKTARVSIFYFNNASNQSITIDKTITEYNLSKSVFPSDGIHLAGVELHSDVRLHIYGFSYHRVYSEGYLSMPMRFASLKYIISALPVYYYSYKNLIVFTPIYEDTVVSISLKLVSGSIIYGNKEYGNNATIKITLNKFNTVQLGTASDLSGTLVTASKPIIVVSGNQCNVAASLPSTSRNCQPFMESVLPTEQLDNIFITPYISTRLNNTVRIQAMNSTNLAITIGNRKESRSINARDFVDFYYKTVSIILSSDDILVMSYPHFLTGRKGDPFMMSIPGVNQYLYEYEFVVPTGFTSFISITVQSDALDGFLLDGNSFNLQSIFSASDGKNYFSTFSLPILAGYHHMEHKTKVPFGLWVYGNRRNDGFGYPAGMAYKIYN